MNEPKCGVLNSEWISMLRVYEWCFIYLKAICAHKMEHILDVYIRQYLIILKREKDVG